MSGFASPKFPVATADGRNVELLADVEYVARDGRRYILPAGATSDGASTPAPLWLMLPPFGEYWRASVLHDLAYRNTLQRADTRAPANLSKQQCDELYLEALGLDHVDGRIAWELYEGVHLGGWRAFHDDRATH